MKFKALFLVFILFSFLSKSQDVYNDIVFDNNIRTVQSTTTVGLGGEVVLSFDYIGTDAPYMLAKIIHCDWDWKQSILVEPEYFNGFNEFQISDVEASSGNKIPFYHYRLVVPKVKLSGNYIILVYDEDKPNITYMTRRFSVYENAVIIKSNSGLANVVSNRYTSQQIDFNIVYGNYEIQNPYETTHAIIKQNNRWDNAKIDLKPSFIGIADKELRYNYFNNESSFSALREYRFFDFVGNRFHVDTWQKENDGDKIFLRQDIDRSLLNYVDQADNNGKYYIPSPYDGEYSHVYFTLNTAQLDDDIYVFGQLSDWKMDDRFKMEYDSTTRMYHTKIVLKQGEYDYSYAINRNGKVDEVTLQGSHSETENDYEILIYHRPFGKYYDKLIGYKRLD